MLYQAQTKLHELVVNSNVNQSSFYNRLSGLKIILFYSVSPGNCLYRTLNQDHNHFFLYPSQFIIRNYSITDATYTECVSNASTKLKSEFFTSRQRTHIHTHTYTHLYTYTYTHTYTLYTPILYTYRHTYTYIYAITNIYWKECNTQIIIKIIPFIKRSSNFFYTLSKSNLSVICCSLKIKKIFDFMPVTLQFKLFSLCTHCPYSILHVVQDYRKTSSFKTPFTKSRESQIWTSGRPGSRHPRRNWLFLNVVTALLHVWCNLSRWETYGLYSGDSGINHTCSMSPQVTP
jgi:hypothetical protein